MPEGDAARTRRFEAVALPQLAAAYNLARWICRNEADAADVVQEAVMRALQYFDSYRGGDARAWLLQIVRNAAHSWIERNRAAGMVRVTDAELEQVAAADDPMAAVAADSAAARLRQAIGQLPLEQREVLILREFEQLSYRQIASILDSPIGTVMSRLSRARDQLAIILRPDMEVPT
ncbi:MAG TPA: sigma-70 family RNA polymerase sigma factor [Steroidobacteraceae bacterium]|jgi:RNA polymerase sigma-70 factor (ECF subfamily)